MGLEMYFQNSWTLNKIISIKLHTGVWAIVVFIMDPKDIPFLLLGCKDFKDHTANPTHKRSVADVFCWEVRINWKTAQKQSKINSGTKRATNILFRGVTLTKKHPAL